MAGISMLFLSIYVIPKTYRWLHSCSVVTKYLTISKERVPCLIGLRDKIHYDTEGMVAGAPCDSGPVNI